MAALKFVRSVSDANRALSAPLLPLILSIRYGSLSEPIQGLNQGKPFSINIQRMQGLIDSLCKDY